MNTTYTMPIESQIMVTNHDAIAILNSLSRLSESLRDRGYVFGNGSDLADRRFEDLIATIRDLESELKNWQ